MQCAFKKAEFSPSQLDLLNSIARTNLKNHGWHKVSIPQDVLPSFQKQQRIWGEYIDAMEYEREYTLIFFHPLILGALVFGFVQVLDIYDFPGFADLCFIVWFAIFCSAQWGLCKFTSKELQKRYVRDLGRPLSSRWICLLESEDDHPVRILSVLWAFPAAVIIWMYLSVAFFMMSHPSELGWFGGIAKMPILNAIIRVLMLGVPIVQQVVVSRYVTPFGTDLADVINRFTDVQPLAVV